MDKKVKYYTEFDNKRMILLFKILIMLSIFIYLTVIIYGIYSLIKDRDWDLIIGLFIIIISLFVILIIPNTFLNTNIYIINDYLKFEIPKIFLFWKNKYMVLSFKDIKEINKDNYIINFILYDNSIHSISFPFTYGKKKKKVESVYKEIKRIHNKYK